MSGDQGGAGSGITAAAVEELLRAWFPFMRVSVEEAGGGEFTVTVARPVGRELGIGTSSAIGEMFFTRHLGARAEIIGARTALRPEGGADTVFTLKVTGGRLTPGRRRAGLVPAGGSLAPPRLRAGRGGACPARGVRRRGPARPGCPPGARRRVPARRQRRRARGPPR